VEREDVADEARKVGEPERLRPGEDPRRRAGHGLVDDVGAVGLQALHRAVRVDDEDASACRPDAFEAHGVEHVLFEEDLHGVRRCFLRRDETRLHVGLEREDMRVGDRERLNRSAGEDNLELRAGRARIGRSGRQVRGRRGGRRLRTATRRTTEDERGGAREKQSSHRICVNV
jgi:hypothetical protein